jgi:hypothetical protein
MLLLWNDYSMRTDHNNNNDIITICNRYFGTIKEGSIKLSSETYLRIKRWCRIFGQFDTIISLQKLQILINNIFFRLSSQCGQLHKFSKKAKTYKIKMDCNNN